ncbi:MAG: 30S ribosomal protein S1 [Alphaproteobacteria bacterium]|nr:30S ribosomal protein S1 [Alphaproteobacteria bacterium]
MSASESFAEIFEETSASQLLLGEVVRGVVTGVENDSVIIDVGLKSEGRISLKEFIFSDEKSDMQVGEEVNVFIDRMENRDGEIVLSREKARRQEAWEHLEGYYQRGERVTGTIHGRVKAGFTVNIQGTIAFLPGSQVDVRPVRDIGPLMEQPQPFQILKMDRVRNNIVVSRRAVLEETRAEKKTELLSNMEEGSVHTGIVKNITNYGAFIDLGGIDGLLHITDISWRRINSPADVLKVGGSVQVKIIRFNKETQRVSLGMKQLEGDPWENVEDKYPIGVKIKGKVTNVTDYGAFIELDSGLEGLVHISEMSWTKKSTNPNKLFSTSEEIEVMVLEIDREKRRIALGVKQCIENPWQSFADKHQIGDVIEGEIHNVTEFGIFIGLPGNIDGMVHASDISWDKEENEAIEAYNDKKKETIQVKILDIDVEKARVGLGIKQLNEDPLAGQEDNIKKGEVVTCRITGSSDGGVSVAFGENEMQGFIKRSELGREKKDQNPERFAIDEKVDAKIIGFDKKNRRAMLSIKAYEIEDEQQAIENYGSSDSGATLGDILGNSLREKQKKNSE